MASPVIVSQGDLSGAGWYLFKRDIVPLKPDTTIIVVGDKTNSKIQGINYVSDIRDIDLASKEIYLLHREKIIDSKPGTPTQDTSVASYENFIRSLKYWNIVKKSALLTLPVSKEMIMKAGIKFSGHTEIIGQHQKSKTFLCMYSRKLITVLLTNHIPLKKTSAALKKVDYDELSSSLLRFLKLMGNQKPVAMLGYNPHAGEGGKIGEEETFLKNKISEMRKAGLKIDGPFPADSYFMNQFYERYGLSLACYHDQGLIPFKALSGLKGVNITLGVSQLRVSPDHGTAYASLVKKEKLSSEGVKSALKFAIKWGEKWVQR